jgi:hypothetical protein
MALILMENFAVYCCNASMSYRCGRVRLAVSAVADA